MSQLLNSKKPMNISKCMNKHSKWAKNHSMKKLKWHPSSPLLKIKINFQHFLKMIVLTVVELSPVNSNLLTTKNCLTVGWWISKISWNSQTIWNGSKILRENNTTKLKDQLVVLNGLMNQWKEIHFPSIILRLKKIINSKSHPRQILISPQGLIKMVHQEISKIMIVGIMTSHQSNGSTNIKVFLHPTEKHLYIQGANIFGLIFN